MSDMNKKEQSRQDMLWYSFWFIVLVTVMAFISAWMDKDLSGINSVIGTSIGALSLLGIGNYATKPGS